ncbi:type IV pilus assembly protein PilF [Chromatocurvus halotolerans]|uniref:Type IV pilus assembly protein PilF n=2 Tax=Chromatocurvus halotolerans TaxID=1132028 RepID=A0A4R2L3Q6_9GAMM|nr:type IV pilus assembly protein PilF [Chromatocurvus halotolerans]
MDMPRARTPRSGSLCALRALPILLCLFALSACITSRDTVFTEPASPDEVLTQRVELARKYIGDGNWDAAKRNLKVAASINDRKPEVHEAFALVYQSTGEIEMAEASYQRAIALDDRFSRARNNYAAFLFSQQRFKEAEQQLQAVVRDTLYEARPRAFINLGLSRLALADDDGAEEAFIRALSMQGNNSIPLLEMASLRLKAGDYRAAAQYYERYRSAVRRQSARGLWLGVRLAQATGDRDAEGSYALALRNLYPESPEYAAYARQAGDS